MRRFVFYVRVLWAPVSVVALIVLGLAILDGPTTITVAERTDIAQPGDIDMAVANQQFASAKPSDIVFLDSYGYLDFQETENETGLYILRSGSYTIRIGPKAVTQYHAKIIKNGTAEYDAIRDLEQKRRNISDPGPVVWF
ncbi:hypothetical protein H0W91_00920 [Patescibacteria group bacterium]|nr:hypothetical protein [Patescibacteria group bacterium]